jgi:hypothetical protein
MAQPISARQKAFAAVAEMHSFRLVFHMLRPTLTQTIFHPQTFDLALNPQTAFEDTVNHDHHHHTTAIIMTCNDRPCPRRYVFDLRKDSQLDSARGNQQGQCLLRGNRR